MGTELLSQYEIPYLHPLVVHFPLVLLLLAAGCAVVYAALGARVWRRAITLLLLPALLTVWMSVQTGKVLLADVEGEPMVELVIAAHETAAVATLWTSVVAFLIVGGLSFWLERRPESLQKDPVLFRIVVLFVVLIPAALVAHTARLGGLMVWGVPAGAS